LLVACFGTGSAQKGGGGVVVEKLHDPGLCRRCAEDEPDRRRRQSMDERLGGAVYTVMSTRGEEFNNKENIVGWVKAMLSDSKLKKL
jgi:hypothetical protein